MKTTNIFFFILASLVFLLPIPAKLHAAEVHFLNGDRLTGRIVKTDMREITMDILGIGVIHISKAQLDQIKTDRDLAQEELLKKAADTEKEKPKRLSGEVSAGFERKTGNTKTTDLYAEGSIKWESKRHILSGKGKTFYSAENRKMNARTNYAMGRYDLKFGKEKRWFNFYQAEVDTDRFANIDYRFVPAAGLGYWFSNRENFKAKLEAGLGMTRTVYRDGTEDESELLLTPKAYVEKLFFEKIKASEELTVYPALTGERDYRWVSDTKVELPLIEQFIMRFQLINQYNSNPGGDTKKNDLHLISGLAYKF